MVCGRGAKESTKQRNDAVYNKATPFRIVNADLQSRWHVRRTDRHPLNSGISHTPKNCVVVATNTRISDLIV